MRFNINLATQPYQDARHFYMRWGGLLALMVLITMALLGTAIKSYLGSRDVTAQTRELQARIDQLNRERASAQALLNNPANREVRERSRFLNTLIARKAFSWTQVFADLEKIMPPRVHVISIRPDFTENNQLQVHLEAVGESREKAIDLVRRMEQSPTFRAPFVRQEKDQTVQSGARGQQAGVEFEIVAQYVPPVEVKAPAMAEQKGGQ